MLENFSTEILNSLNFMKNMLKEHVPLNSMPMKSKEILVNVIVCIYASPFSHTHTCTDMYIYCPETCVDIMDCSHLTVCSEVSY